MKKIILFIILSVSFSSYADEINLLMIPDDPDAVRIGLDVACLLYTSPSPRDRQKSRMPSSA